MTLFGDLFSHPYIFLNDQDWADWMKDRLHGEDPIVRYALKFHQKFLCGV